MPAAALPPGNDLCGSAEVIPSFIGSFAWVTTVTELTDATTDGDPLYVCEGSVSGENIWLANSLWYRFTPAETATYTISSCADAPTMTTVRDTVMAIYTSANPTNECEGPFIQLTESCNRQSCGDDACGPGGLQAAITTRLLGDTNYFIVLWRYDDGTPAEPSHAAVQLRVEKSQPRANDTCSGATPLRLNVPKAGTTVGARDDYNLLPDSCLVSGTGSLPSPAEGPDVVYSFTPPESGPYSFKVSGYSRTRTNNLVLYLLNSCPTGQPPMIVTQCLAGANRNPATRAEEISCAPLLANETVYLIVDDGGCMPGSAFTVEVTRCLREVEPNDTPANATPFGCNLTGAVSPVGNVDYYSLGAPAPGTRLFALVDGSAANDDQFDLRVTTGTHTLEFDNADNDAVFGSRSPNIAGTPLTGMDTFLQVSGGGAAPLEPYRLYAAVQPPLWAAVPESEPNNGAEEANFSTTNFFFGTLPGPSPSLDLDVFGFSVSTGEVVMISLDADPLRDGTPMVAKLELIDALTNVLMVVNDGFNPYNPCYPAYRNLANTNRAGATLSAITPFSPAQGMVFRASKKETLYVRVSSGTTCADARGEGDYLLSITKDCPVCCQMVRARFLTLEHSPDGIVRICLRGGPAQRYEIQCSTDLATWSSKGTITAGPDGAFEFTDTENPQPPQFYRAVWVW